MIVLKKNFLFLTYGGTPVIITILLRSAPTVLIILGEIIGYVDDYDECDEGTTITYLVVFILSIVLLILLFIFAIIGHLFGSWLFWGAVIACILNGIHTFVYYGFMLDWCF